MASMLAHLVSNMRAQAFHVFEQFGKSNRKRPGEGFIFFCWEIWWISSDFHQISEGFPFSQQEPGLWEGCQEWRFEFLWHPSIFASFSPISSQTDVFWSYLSITGFFSPNSAYNLANHSIRMLNKEVLHLGRSSFSGRDAESDAKPASTRFICLMLCYASVGRALVAKTARMGSIFLVHCSRNR